MSPGGFRAKSRAVLGIAQAPRVKASQGFYCSGFIQPTKQTKDTNEQENLDSRPALHMYYYPKFKFRVILFGYGWKSKS